VPVLLQIAELGGPILLSSLCLAVNGAIYEVVTAVRLRRPLPYRAPLAVLGCVVATVVYGAVRIAQMDAAVEEAPQVRVGLVQTNMGIFAKRAEAREGHLRHLAQTPELERTARPDLIIWPETALA
jgi:apolipoprotein N-acyltransferase